MVEAKSSNPKSSNPINQSNGEKRMEDKVIMIEKPNTSHPIKPKRYSTIYSLQFYNSFELLISLTTFFK
ncbi:unnamed protein product [Trifolium pratense]|uniref:Uncharacterized protein n=1 Tax=Trifolium pratense TaxID=57577 RepID=A0ACB0L952_TRIPR|nr:unnamed protein product [Trifolium pratense]